MRYFRSGAARTAARVPISGRRREAYSPKAVPVILTADQERDI